MIATSQLLDSLDLAIVAQLQEDGRAPLTDLAQRVGVSHGTVRNRLERLLSEEIIRITAIIVDPAKVGFPTQVYIGINADLAQAETIEKRVPQFDEVNYFATLTGRLDFLIGAVFRSDAELREFLVHKLANVKGIRATETSHVLHLGKRVWQWRLL